MQIPAHLWGVFLNMTLRVSGETLSPLIFLSGHLLNKQCRPATFRSPLGVFLAPPAAFHHIPAAAWPTGPAAPEPELPEKTPPEYQQ